MFCVSFCQLVTGGNNTLNHTAWASCNENCVRLCLFLEDETVRGPVSYIQAQHFDKHDYFFEDRYVTCGWVCVQFTYVNDKSSRFSLFFSFSLSFSASRAMSHSVRPFLPRRHVRAYSTQANGKADAFFRCSLHFHRVCG